MERLPVELIQRICAYLCHHCHRPDSFCHAETWDVRESKDALASLSATSSRFRAIAQPILFHYFATGNLIPRHPRDFPGRDSQLPLFIRSLIRRPDLAARVRALQLVQSHQFAQELNFHADCLRPVFEKVHHGLSDDPDYNYTKDRIGQWLASDGTGHPDHQWLVQIPLLLVPNLETLSVARDFADYGILELGSGTLPSLRSIALQPLSEPFHIHEAKALFAAAPNLEVLYALGCGYKDPGNNPNYGMPFELRLGNLRKLVIEGVELYDLAMLLPSCPQLQELQYVRPDCEAEERDTVPLEVLAPLQRTLRTLKFKFTQVQIGGDFPRMRPTMFTTIKSLRDFAALEELVIEQYAISCPTAPTPGGARLVDWLPPSVERVHFRDVEEAIPLLAHLSVVASEAAERLPKLRSVRITRPWYYEDADEGGLDSLQPLLDRATAEFDQAGIAFEDVDPAEGEREPWLDRIYPELSDKAKHYGYLTW